MNRRTFIKTGSLDRLNQGPFGIEQDQGWYTILVTSQSNKHVKNYGLGLIGYTWEEFDDI